MDVSLADSYDSYSSDETSQVGPLTESRSSTTEADPQPGLTPDDLVVRIPTATVVTIPEGWLDDLKDTPNVFIQFYEELVFLGCSAEGLHNRARVGHFLMKRLRRSEKARLRRVHGLAGEELNRALSWNDLDSGPRESFGGHRIIGNSVCILPPPGQLRGRVETELHQEALEVSRKLRQRKRTETSGSSFYYWIIGAREQDDRIGDIARDIYADETFPRGLCEYNDVLRHLESVGANEATIECAEDAWLEYQGRYPDRAVPRVRCQKCSNVIKPGDGAVLFRFGYEVLHWKCNTDADPIEDRVLVEDLHRHGISRFRDLAERHEGFWSGAVEKQLQLSGFREARSSPGWVYFAQRGLAGPIKIGFTSTSVAQRLAQLQTGSAEPLRLLAAIEGDRHTERHLHAQFEPFRRKGEWFEPHPSIVAFLAPIVAKKK